MQMDASIKSAIRLLPANMPTSVPLSQSLNLYHRTWLDSLGKTLLLRWCEQQQPTYMTALCDTLPQTGQSEGWREIKEKQITVRRYARGKMADMRTSKRRQRRSKQVM